MARQPKTIVQTRQPGQYNLELPNYLFRMIPAWGVPKWYEADMWRRIVRSQPIATICKETLISNILALDWLIEPIDSNHRDELKSEIDYYTKLLSNPSDLDFSGHLEWLCADLLDLPFGGASEVGREGDKSEGKVLWVENLDAATLYPTLVMDWPVMQKLPENPAQIVYFPAHAISRIYMSPRSDIHRKGWGMAPPEKIYLALELLNRGDYYYANMLLDTPEAGILDLGDMSKASAEEWVSSFRTLLSGIDGFKIPVLYEHNNKVDWIPFGKPPTEIMFDKLTLKYAAIICAGYGMTLGDIGLSSSSSSGGETLAGTIRGERKTRRTGLATLKKKLINYYNSLLPETLKFKWIDYDDEIQAALGRARLSSATAFRSLIDVGVLSPNESRAQLLADGLITISIPETIPEGNMPIDATSGKLPNGIRNPDTSDQTSSDRISPSMGGHGDVKATKSTFEELEITEALTDTFTNGLSEILQKDISDRLTRLVYLASKKMIPQFKAVASSMTPDEVLIWRNWMDNVLFGETEVPEVVSKALDDVEDVLDSSLDEDRWWELPIVLASLTALYATAYEAALRDSIGEMTRRLYYEGILSSPEIPSVISVRNNTRIMEMLSEMAQESLTNVNAGNRYYIKHIVMSKINEAFSRPDILDKIDNGFDINEILSDNNFTRTIVLAISAELLSVFKDRASIISEFEFGKVMNSAISEEFSRLGLSKKAWECYGADPCPICLKNKAAGFVELSYVYESTFGGTTKPKAHPRCQCGLKYDSKELLEIAGRNSFQFWYGE